MLKSYKIFYGWYIVFSGMVVASFFSMMYSYGFTAFVNPIAGTFGWTMAQVSLAMSLMGLETGVFNPIIGPIVDRYSPAMLMRIGVILTAIGTFVLSQCTDLFTYYLGFFIDGLGSTLVIGILPIAVISRWFKKDIGKANGLFYMGAGIGGVLVPLVVMLIDWLGWRTTLMYGSIGFLVLGLPLSFVFRSRPEDYGMIPDGREDKIKDSTKPRRDYNFGTRVKDALKMRAFWHLVGINVFQQAYLGTLQMFTIPYLSDLGMSRTTAATVITTYTILSLASRIPMGFLADIFKKTRIIALSVILQTAGVLIFWLMGGSSPFWMVILFGVCYGVGIAGIMPLRAPVLVEYFGNKNFGTIYGLSGIFTTAAAVFSAPLAGWIFDTWSDYKPYWLAGVVLGALALVAILTIPPPPRR